MLQSLLWWICRLALLCRFLLIFASRRDNRQVMREHKLVDVVAMLRRAVC